MSADVLLVILAHDLARVPNNKVVDNHSHESHTFCAHVYQNKGYPSFLYGNGAREEANRAKRAIFVEERYLARAAE